MKLVELAQFVLNRRTEDIRSELYEYLVCGAIYHAKEKDGLTEQDILASLKEFYELDTPSRLVSSYVRNLVSKKDLIPVQREDQPAYILSETKLAEISSSNKDYENLRDNVIQEILTRVKKSYPDLPELQATEIVNVFFLIISSIFKRYGSICSDVIAGKMDEIKDIPKLPDFQQISLNSVKRIGNPSLRKVVKDEFRNFFVQPSSHLVYFLHSMAQSYTIAQILNIDPDLQTLEKERFSKKKMFLDTNIIVSLMCIAQAHESVTEIVSLTKDLGIKMVYTPETKKEFFLFLKNSDKLYRRNPIQNKSIVKKTEPLMENPFIRSYWVESGEKRLAWNGFVARMEGFEEFLKDKFSITVDTTRIEGVWSDPEYQELESAVSWANIGKSQPTVAHDAYHLLMIKKIREKETVDELGMNSYFLTRDYTLDTAEHIVYRGGRIPSHLPIDVWSQMILPFLSPRIVADEASSTYMKVMNSKFPSLTKSIDPEDVIDIMGIWMEDPSVTTELLRKMIGTSYMHKHLQKIREEGEIKPSEISKAIGPILKQVICVKTKKHESELSDLEEKYDQEISTLKEEIESLKSSPPPRKEIHKPFFVTGISFFVALIALALASGFLQYTLSDAVYWVLGVCGLALIACSVYGSEVFEKFKRL